MNSLTVGQMGSIDLLFNKYVIARKAHPGDAKWLNNVDATEIMARGDPIWLGIPVTRQTSSILQRES
ncbi:MAG: hypothetical protein ACTSUE_05565 [Promethearchaeota archaeon]